MYYPWLQDKRPAKVLGELRWDCFFDEIDGEGADLTLPSFWPLDVFNKWHEHKLHPEECEKFMYKGVEG